MVTIPKFVVNQLYVRGSLQQTPDGEIRFAFQSKLMSGHLTGVVRICVGQVCFEAGQVTLTVSDGLVRRGSGLSESEPLWVPPQNDLVISLMGNEPVLLLDAGRYEVGLTLRSQELGEFQFEIVDELRRVSG